MSTPLTYGIVSDTVGGGSGPLPGTAAGSVGACTALVSAVAAPAGGASGRDAPLVTGVVTELSGLVTVVADWTALVPAGDPEPPVRAAVFGDDVGAVEAAGCAGADGSAESATAALVAAAAEPGVAATGWGAGLWATAAGDGEGE